MHTIATPSRLLHTHGYTTSWKAHVQSTLAWTHCGQPSLTTSSKLDHQVVEVSWPT